MSYVPVGIGGRWSVEAMTGGDYAALEGPAGMRFEDAERILNAHDDLVKALEVVLPLAEKWADGGGRHSLEVEEVNAAKATLTKARTP